jgi:hypothetical protein
MAFLACVGGEGIYRVYQVSRSAGKGREGWDMTGLLWACGFVLAHVDPNGENIDWFGLSAMLTAIAALVTAGGGFWRNAVGQKETHQKLDQVVGQFNGNLHAAVREAVTRAVAEAILVERQEAARRIQASGGGKDPGP